MLQDMRELDIDYFRSILSAVHSEGANPTSYANICDLTSGDLYVYNFHNFEEVAKLNLKSELKKGKHSYALSTLFPRKTNAQLAFERSQNRSLASILNRTIDEEGVDSAIKRYREVKDQYPGIANQMKHLVFLLGLKGKIGEAIEIYRIFASDHAETAGVHKILGGPLRTRRSDKRGYRMLQESLGLGSEFLGDKRNFESTPVELDTTHSRPASSAGP